LRRKQKPKKQQRISIALELIEWAINGCLAKVMVLIKRKKITNYIMDITIITEFLNN